VLDAIVYLLSTTQFIADLQSIVERGSLSSPKPSNKPKLLDALARLAREVSSSNTLNTLPKVLSPYLLEVFHNLNTCSESDLSNLLKEKREENQEALESINQELSYYRDDEEKRLAFQSMIQAWFGKDLSNWPGIDWQRGQQVASYLLYVCSFILLERVAQLNNSVEA
jgi:hypothetical protein